MQALQAAEALQALQAFCLSRSTKGFRLLRSMRSKEMLKPLLPQRFALAYADVCRRMLTYAVRVCRKCQSAGCACGALQVRRWCGGR